MTPFEIEILLWYYCRTVDHNVVVTKPPIWPAMLNSFIANGLMETTERYEDMRAYQLTDKGRCYVQDGLCRVPLPTQKWEIPKYVNEI